MRFLPSPSVVSTGGLIQTLGTCGWIGGSQHLLIGRWLRLSRRHFRCLVAHGHSTAA
jgi:hypothetical protein